MMRTKLLPLTILFFFFYLCSGYFNTLTACSNENAACVSPLYAPTFSAAFEVEEADAAFQRIGKYIKSKSDLGDYRLKTIVIDAGHGGRDHGCSGEGSSEKDIALRVALLLGQTIKHHFPAIKVIYTRDSDVFIPLHKRADIANRNHADLFISIHCNSIPNASHIKGSETYVLGLHRAEDNLAVAKRENMSILMEDNYKSNYGGYDPNSAEGHIILSMFQNAFLEQSISFAEKVEKQIQIQANRRSRGVKQAGFLVLRETTMPSVLIETGYLTNSSDNEFLITDYGQRQMAFSIYKAFVEYKGEVEEQSTATIATAVATPAPLFASEADNMPAVQRQATAPVKVNQPAGRPEEQLTAKGGLQGYILQKASTPPAVVQFKVQLTVSAKLIETNTPYWHNVDHSIEVIRDNNTYKYLAIGFDSYESATAAKSELRKKGFKEAFVVAYENGSRIAVDEAREKSRSIR